MKWDPDVYLSFERARLQPALDLINRIPDQNFVNIADIGCGPGNVTLELLKIWPHAKITGYDNSLDMLKRAETLSADIKWTKIDAANFAPPNKQDLIFSNACLQWLPNHAALLPKLLKQINDGGVLAIQMPNNYLRPTHVLAETAAHDCGVMDDLKDLFSDPPVHPAADYYDILQPHCRFLDIWETDYLQILEGDNPVADWTKGSYLRPLLERLKGQKSVEFEERYRKLISKAYPSQASGKTLLPFKRLFILAIK